MTIAYFSISGLDILGALDDDLGAEKKLELIDWIYSLQVDLLEFFVIAHIWYSTY